jgi:signal peptidase I
MEPIFKGGDRILACSPKLSGLLKRGDVVFFKTAGLDRFRIKRVIGLSNETLEISKGKVFINEQKLHNYVHGLPDTSNYGPILIPKDHYFLMGDNRNVSEDSRDFGPIPLNRIFYRALAIYKPFSHFKILL